VFNKNHFDNKCNIIHIFLILKKMKPYQEMYMACILRGRPKNSRVKVPFLKLLIYPYKEN